MQAGTPSRQSTWLCIVLLTLGGLCSSEKQSRQGGEGVGDTKPSRFVGLRIEGNRIEHVDRSGIFGWSTHWVRSKCLLWFRETPSGKRLRNRAAKIDSDCPCGALVAHGAGEPCSGRPSRY